VDQARSARGGQRRSASWTLPGKETPPTAPDTRAPAGNRGRGVPYSLCGGFVFISFEMEFLEPSVIVRQWLQPDLATSVIDSVRIGQRPELPAAAGHQELGAIQLLATLGQQHPVSQVGVMAGVGLAGPNGAVQQLQAEALEGRVAVGVLDQQPGRLGAVIADQAAAGPAARLHDGLHAGGVGGIHGPDLFGRGRLLLGHVLSRAWMAVQTLAGVLVGGGHGEQLIAQTWVHGAHGATLSLSGIFAGCVQAARALGVQVIADMSVTVVVR
jgi:hypothetical protein